MIRSKADRDRYFAADMASTGVSRWRLWTGIRHPVLAFQKRLRHTEYVVNTARGPIGKLRKFVCLYNLRAAGIRLGFTVHPNVFGPGLCIVHWGTLVVNPNVRIGANCRIHPGTSLGASDGGAPAMGDDCYIGPGAKLFGPITLGDRVRVGANAVVNKSFGSDCVLVGVPAKALPQDSGGGGDI